MTSIKSPMAIVNELREMGIPKKAIIRYIADLRITRLGKPNFDGFTVPFSLINLEAAESMVAALELSTDELLDIVRQ